MTEINYKSDFDFILTLRTCAGEDIGFPDYNWHAQFRTTNSNIVFTASYKDGECTNCFNDNGKIHIVANAHGLRPGELTVEFFAELPNDIYPDDSRLNVTIAPLDIKLIRGTAPCISEIEAEAIMPYIKGEAFTYEDFTEEQIATLQAPAIEAALSANAATAATIKATSDALNAAAQVDASISASKAATEKAEEATQGAEKVISEWEAIKPKSVYMAEPTATFTKPDSTGISRFN